MSPNTAFKSHTDLTVDHVPNTAFKSHTDLIHSSCPQTQPSRAMLISSTHHVPKHSLQKSYWSHLLIMSPNTAFKSHTDLTCWSCPQTQPSKVILISPVDHVPKHSLQEPWWSHPLVMSLNAAFKNHTDLTCWICPQTRPSFAILISPVDHVLNTVFKSHTDLTHWSCPQMQPSRAILISSTGHVPKHPSKTILISPVDHVPKHCLQKPYWSHLLIMSPNVALMSCRRMATIRRRNHWFLCRRSNTSSSIRSMMRSGMLSAPCSTNFTYKLVSHINWTKHLRLSSCFFFHPQKWYCILISESYLCTVDSSIQYHSDKWTMNGKLYSTCLLSKSVRKLICLQLLYCNDTSKTFFRRILVLRIVKLMITQLHSDKNQNKLILFLTKTNGNIQRKSILPCCEHTQNKTLRESQKSIMYINKVNKVTESCMTG